MISRRRGSRVRSITSRTAGVTSCWRSMIIGSPPYCPPLSDNRLSVNKRLLTPLTRLQQTPEVPAVRCRKALFAATGIFAESNFLDERLTEKIVYRKNRRGTHETHCGQYDEGRHIGRIEGSRR